MKNKHLRSRLSLILITVLSFVGIPAPDVYADSLSSLAIYAGEAMAIQGKVVSYNKVSENTPSINSVIEINTALDLIDLAKNANIDSYTQNKSFIMTTDLDMSGYSFSSIPTFSGVFDGNGHSITGLYYGDNGYASGLFRYIRHGAVVQNLTLNADIDAADKKDITGGICAINEGIISNCTFEGKIQAKTITGGIAAINEVPGTIMACTNKASIYGYYYTGGITGKNYGVVAYSNNYGELNNTTEWVEESDAMAPGNDAVSAIISGGTDALNPFHNASDTTVRANNGVDTGGIAGYSKGAVYQCKNHATVGYEHTGYNVGGIVGRQAGFVSFCYNDGEVYGRKDIGGIVGQMEPHLTLDDLESLPDAIDKLHDLVDVSLGDIDSSVDTISDDVKLLSAYADNAVTAGDTLTTTTKNYLNSVSYTANSLTARVDYLTDKMPKFFEYLSRANDHLSDTSDSLNKLVDDADVYKRLSSNEIVSINTAADTISSNTSTLPEKIKAADTITTIMIPHTLDAASTISGNRSSVKKNIDKVTGDIDDGYRYSKDVIKHINDMDNPGMPYLGSDFDTSRELLRLNLKGMTDTLSALSDHSDLSSEKVTADLKDVNDQVNTVFHIISDELDTIGNFASGKSDDIVTDVSDEEIENIEEGRVDHCSNTGTIRGDINIGGIAGAMSIDTDDPEENAAGSMDGGFSAKYLLRNVVLDCENDSAVESKKDGVGGVVGYMEHGIVAGSDSYGSVASAEGSYVGGIAGQSHSIIKDSCATNTLNGNSFIGGIAGYGTTIRACSSIPTFESTGDRHGSIAGQIDTDSETHAMSLDAVSGNTFVNDTVAGIDNMSFAGHAEPVSYDGLVSGNSIPSKFNNMRITFRVDDEIILQTSLPYGSSLSKLEPPILPPSDGEYILWEEYDKSSRLTGPIIIEGEKYMLEKTLTSDELYPGTSAHAALISGNFIKGDRLNVSVSADDMSVDYTLTYTSEHESGISALRLYSPFKKSALYGISEDGTETLLSEKKKGSYMEAKGGLSYDSYRIKNTSLLDKIKSKLNL